VASDLAELAAGVDLICVMVRDDDQVREVLGGVVGVVRPADAPPLTVVIHSTVGPTTPAELGDVGERHGVRVLDAPVSGGAAGAAEGTLAIMVGGDPEAYAAVAPVLALMGSKIVYAGPVGAGTRMKLARNLLHFVSFTAATEAQRLAEAAGLDLVALGDVVRHTDAITGGPGAIMHRDSTAPLRADDFWHGVFSHVVALGEKDLGFAIDLADQLGVDVPLARLARTHLAPGLGLTEGATP
jgi:3-hydroxyisobutyrate dehydrogenase